MTNQTTADQIAREEVDEILIEVFSLNDYPDMVECPACDGDGFRPVDRAAPCLQCGGEGEVGSGESPANEFRRDEAGCSYRTREGHVWMSPALIADLMDRAYRAGRESV
jgi:DnaJ-class molecular chaperone